MVRVKFSIAITDKLWNLSGLTKYIYFSIRLLRNPSWQKLYSSQNVEPKVILNRDIHLVIRWRKKERMEKAPPLIDQVEVKYIPSIPAPGFLSRHSFILWKGNLISHGQLVIFAPDHPGQISVHISILTCRIYPPHPGNLGSHMLKMVDILITLAFQRI